MIGLFDPIQYKLGQTPLWRILSEELGGPLNFYSFAFRLRELQRLKKLMLLYPQEQSLFGGGESLSVTAWQYLETWEIFM